MRAIATALVALTACAAESGTTGTAPTIVIDSPERGSSSAGGTVTVSGRVIDDGPVTLNINGTQVTAETDGSFSATITVGIGLGIIETVATDAGGNAARDVRAVLSGMVVASDGTLAAPLGARAGVEALRGIGTAMGNTAEGLDYTALVKQFNPIYKNDGCLGATVNVTSVAMSNIGVTLVPRSGGLEADVEIANVVVKADAAYKFSCFGGNTTITVRASKARLGGMLGVALQNGKLTTSLPGVGVALDGFSFEIGGVPGAVEDLLKGKVREGIENALKDVIAARVPPIANGALAGLLAKPITTTILGRELTATAVPTAVKVTADGLFVAVESKLSVAGGEGGMYVATPQNVTEETLTGVRGIGIAVADDAVNQLFAGLWASGALERTLAIEDTGPLAAILDDDATTLDVKLMLPPSMTTGDDTLRLSIGDLIVTTRDAGGQEVQRIAISLHSSIAAAPSQEGKVLLTLGKPEVKAQVITQTEVVQRPLTDEGVEGIVDAVWSLVGSQASDALSKLPLPAVGGIQLGAPAVAAKDGFLVADIGVN
ncbi:MAG TPA: Ig-like domain-containing protein [Kofleriaceae bacterium]